MNSREVSSRKTGWAPVVVVSVLVHAAILGGILTLSPLSDKPRKFYAPAMTVNLIGPGPTRPAAPSSPRKVEAAPRPAPKVEAKVTPPPKETPAVRATPPPKVKPVPKAAPAPKPPVEAKAVEPAKPKEEPPAKQESVPDPEEADVKAGLEEIRERLAKERAGEGIEGPGGPPRGGVSSVTLDLRHRAYYNQVWQILEEAWVLPSSARAETLRAIVSIGVDPAGKIIEIKFERRSGDRYFDESVERALAKVAQLPAPPEASSGSTFRVGLRFTPRVQ